MLNFQSLMGFGKGSMPYTAWKCMGQQNGSSTENVPMEASENVSLLAIAWDRKVQVAKLVQSELKIYEKWTLKSSAIGVAWLDDQMLVVLFSSLRSSPLSSSLSTTTSLFSILSLLMASLSSL